jgi:hypothetical protein
VTLVIYSLMLSRPFWKGEDSPVVETSDGTAATEDKGAGCSCNSAETLLEDEGYV